MLKVLITGGNSNLANIIKQNLHNYYSFTLLSRRELNMLHFSEVKAYLDKHKFDVVIHTAISGGRRTKEETGEVTHTNILMFENLIKFSNNFIMIINLDSGAIYDRKTDILHRKEEELYTVPSDYYGFSKYCIYNRTVPYPNVFNLRIFNIFHSREESDRFISRCFHSKKTYTPIPIFQDKYFDFVYETDFAKIVAYYLHHISNQGSLHKTINIGYENKYLLSDIAMQIINDKSLIHIENTVPMYNYSGNSSRLYSYGIEFDGIEKGIELYKKETESFSKGN
jgi:nucleoside-diphosphate-sugar epimerase